MDINNIVAENIKQIRNEKKLTLDAAAELTGVSRSMLAQIEKGDVNPTITVLWKIAVGYKVSFTSLLEKKGEKVSVIKCAGITPLTEDGGRYINYPIFPFDDQKLFETYRIVIKPGGYLSARPHLKNSEEYVTVFSGSAEITVGTEHFELSKGDSMHFPADTNHSYRNRGEETSELSMLIYYSK